MNQEPDNYEDERQNGGATAWTVIAMVIFMLIVASLFGCTAPLIESHITANGNTVPLVGQ